MCIYVEPVTMPCTHTLCMPCFKHNVEATSLTCPLCRKRISSWARRAARDKTLVNDALWNKIQSMFPDKVEKRLDGDDEEDDAEINGIKFLFGRCVEKTVILFVHSYFMNLSYILQHQAHVGRRFGRRSCLVAAHFAFSRPKREAEVTL